MLVGELELRVVRTASADLVLCAVSNLSRRAVLRPQRKSRHQRAADALWSGQVCAAYRCNTIDCECACARDADGNAEDRATDASVTTEAINVRDRCACVCASNCVCASRCVMCSLDDFAFAPTRAGMSNEFTMNCHSHLCALGVALFNNDPIAQPNIMKQFEPNTRVCGSY